MDVTVVHYQSIADFDWKCELELQKSNINEIVDYELSLSIQHGSQIKGDKSHIIYYKFCATTIALESLESLDVCYGNRTSIRKSDHSEQLYIHLHWPFSLWEEADTNQTSNSIKEVYNGCVKVSWDFSLVYRKKKSCADIEIRVYQLVTFYPALDIPLKPRMLKFTSMMNLIFVA